MMQNIAMIDLFPHYFIQLFFPSVTPAAWPASAGPLRLAYLPV